jgi:hypothetical protein
MDTILITLTALFTISLCVILWNTEGGENVFEKEYQDCDTCKHDDQFNMTPSAICQKCLKGEDVYENSNNVIIPQQV